jgi:hypothetical protein
MTSNNSPADERPISQEDITSLISALDNTTVGSKIDFQPILKALEQFARNQAAFQKEIANLKKMIDLQRTEIQDLKKQDNTIWLKQYLNRPMILGAAALLVLAFALPLTLLSLFIPAKLDSDTIEKLNFLYLQEAARLPKTNKSSK